MSVLDYRFNKIKPLNDYPFLFIDLDHVLAISRIKLVY